MSRRAGRRALALGSLAAGIAVGALVVLDALGSSPTTLPTAQAASAPVSRTIVLGHAKVSLEISSRGRTCAAVGRTRACTARLAADQIVYASSASGVVGAAGPDVRAVVLKLTRKGTTWTTLRDGAFYAALPAAHRLRAVVKVLRDGSRRTFTVSATR